VYALAWVLEELGEVRDARSAFSRVGYNDSLRQLAAGYLLMLDDKPAQAVRTMLTLADDLERRPEFWSKFYSADARLLSALSELRLRHRGVAIGHLERTLATLSGTANVLGATAGHRRRVARVEALLARALLATDRAVAARHAATAADWYRTAGGYDAQLAEMTAIIKGSP
jgi:hypothetical protein